MAYEIDRHLLPQFIQTSFAVSLGGMLKTVEMIKDPIGSFQDLTVEVKTLTAPRTPEALASTWLARGSHWIEECRAAGNKLTR